MRDAAAADGRPGAYRPGPVRRRGPEASGGQRPPAPSGRQLQYQLSRVIAAPLLRAYGRPRLLGGDSIPASGPAILASNHLSVIDSVYLPLLLGRPVTFPAKAEYFTARGPAGRAWASYLRRTSQLAIDRDDPRAAQVTLDAALKLLGDGRLLGFYPEGTRSPDGRLYRARFIHGTVRLARRTRRPG
jgi:1-acyl-sn-glycerol-3-phosphate acyltransferase